MAAEIVAAGETTEKITDVDRRQRRRGVRSFIPAGGNYVIEITL
jgi:hypothetical protein